MSPVSFLRSKLVQLFIIQTLTVGAAGSLVCGAGADSGVAAKVAKGGTAEISSAWGSYYDEAMRGAKKSGKDVLIAFVGPAWDKASANLVGKVLSKPDFCGRASISFELVYIDLSAEGSKTNQFLAEQNHSLIKKYKIDDVPVLFVTDSEGKPYQVTGALEGANAEKYLKHVLELRKKKEQIVDLFTQAASEKLDPAAQVELLDAAFGMMNPAVAENFHSEKIDYIIAVDRDNSLGLRNKYAVPRYLKKVRQAIGAGQFEVGARTADMIIRELRPKGVQLQQVYFARSEALFRLGDGQGQLDSLNLALQAAPESQMAEQIKRTIQFYFMPTSQQSGAGMRKQ